MCENKDTYALYDADSATSPPFEVEKDKVIPCPTTLPAQKRKNAEFKVGTTVLSVWATKEGQWTSVFYPATVLSPPSVLGKSYKLQFVDDTGDPIVVPEHCVVRSPSQ